MESEIWMPCAGIDYPIEVSNHGRARSLDRTATVSGRSRNGKPQAAHTQRRPGKILSPCTTKSGYLEVALMVDGKRRKYCVHRLVGMAFVDGYFEGASIDHLDGNKKNNLPSNLEWVTLSENTKRQWATGLVDLRGELAPGAKITNAQAHAIFVLVENGFMVSQISDWFGVSTSCIYKIRDGKRHMSA
jgi:hypothetical protein